MFAAVQVSRRMEAMDASGVWFKDGRSEWAEPSSPAA